MTMTKRTRRPDPRERTLLIVADDKAFLTRLARAMRPRLYGPTADSVAMGC